MEKNKAEVSRWKEIIKIRAEINETETKKTIAKLNKTKSQFCEKINKINKPLARLIKKKRERTQINKIRNKNISNEQPNLTPRAIREKRTKKLQTQQKERNHKDQSEINEKELKETIAKINKTKRCFFEKIKEK